MGATTRMPIHIRIVQVDVGEVAVAREEEALVIIGSMNTKTDTQQTLMIHREIGAKMPMHI